MVNWLGDKNLTTMITCLDKLESLTLSFKTSLTLKPDKIRTEQMIIIKNLLTGMLVRLIYWPTLGDWAFYTVLERPHRKVYRPIFWAKLGNIAWIENPALILWQFLFSKNLAFHWVIGKFSGPAVRSYSRGFESGRASMDFLFEIYVHYQNSQTVKIS